MDIVDPCFKLPNRKQMSARLLTEKCNNTQRDIIARLRDVDHVSVTLDLAVKPTDALIYWSYMYMSLHPGLGIKVLSVGLL